MNNNKLVSIIIPTFNREKTIERAIRSALNQTYQNIEIIVVDNCSTDGSNDIINKLASENNKVKSFKNTTNIGPVKNWIICLEKSKGEYVKFLFSDDAIEPDWIQKSIEIFTQDKEIGFVFSPALIETKNLKYLNYNFFSKSKTIDSREYIFLNYFYLSMPVSPCCAIFRKIDLINALVEEIPNPFNIIYSQTGAGNDLLIYLNIAKIYSKVYFLKDTFVNFYGGADSLTISNNLSLHYEYAKIHFLNIYKKYNFLYTIKLYFGSSRKILHELKFKYKFSFYELYLLIKLYSFKKR